MTDDEQLITRFAAEVAAGFPAAAHSGSHVELHAELLHRLCLAEGLLELLEFSRAGLGADPLACMWLGSLRWHRLVTGTLPAKAPVPPERPSEHALKLLLTAGALTITPGTAEPGLRGLASGEMAYPSGPAQPELADDSVLLRLAPIGLVPYIETSMRQSWAEQAVCLTHGLPDLVERAKAQVTELAAGTGRSSADRHSADHSSAGHNSAGPQLPELIGVVVEDLSTRWHRALTA